MNKRIKLIEKMPDYKPSEKELQEAYEHLDYCLSCGKKFILFEPTFHGIAGNVHRFGCNKAVRILAIITYPFFAVIILYPLYIIIALVSYFLKLLRLKHE